MNCWSAPNLGLAAAIAVWPALATGQSAGARSTRVQWRPATEVLSQSSVRAIAQDLANDNPRKLMESMQAYKLARQPKLVLIKLGQ